jgi:hypothetical protein
LSSGKENAENNGRGYLLPGDRLEARGFGAVMQLRLISRVDVENNFLLALGVHPYNSP